MAARVQLCGALAVEWDGEALGARLPGRRGRLLFAYLVLHRARPVTRDELAEAAGTAEVAPVLSRLRKALGEGRLAGRGELRLLLPDDAWVDWEVAADGIERARAAVRSGAWAQAWGPASAARAIAERGLLPGLEAEWIEPLRAQLADLRVEALELLARIGVELGGEELAPAEHAARAAVEAAPFRESARAVLMDALAARGNVAEALLVYDDARTLLRDELGAAPGPALAARHEALLRTPPAPPPPAPFGAALPAGTAPPPTAAPPPTLVERERELASLAAVLDSDPSAGGVLVIEGPAGVGKTELLGEARRAAAERGRRVLAARAGELERDFAFGVVRQLFEAELVGDERRAALLRGAAAPAAAVFGDAGAEGDASFAALHGLYWLAVGLAAERATVLAVDDLQWCDPASLRFLVYLARRLEGVPLLVAATLRTGEAPTDQALLDELLRDPATSSIRPGPLRRAAVARLAAAALGAQPDDAFTAACHDATGGNPLLLRRLLAALCEDGVAPVAAAAQTVAEVGARAVSRSVLTRLARLEAGGGGGAGGAGSGGAGSGGGGAAGAGAAGGGSAGVGGGAVGAAGAGVGGGGGAVEVARAVAVLGEGARLPAVAALAGLPEDEAADAVAALVRADILRPEAQLGFVHPLVRAAVYDALAPTEREARHARAARMLADRGAPAGDVALHLLVVPPRGDPWAADVLHRAGREALRRGALDSALAHLRRALAEPPPETERPALLLELGEVEREVDAAAAVEHLRAAHEALSDPRERAFATGSLMWTLFFAGAAAELLDVMEAALRELPPELEDERDGIEALGIFTAYWFGVADTSARFAELRERPPERDDGGAKMLLAATAWQWAVSDGPAGRCVDLALRALHGDRLIARDPALLLSAAASVLGMADHEHSLAPWERLRTLAHRGGSAMVKVPIDMWRGWALGRRGELVEAEAALREAIAGQVLWGLGPEVRAYTVGLAAETLLERGDVGGVRTLVEGAVEPPRGSDLRTFLLTARAQLALAEGDPARAAAATDELAAAPGPIENPAWVRWRSARVQALAALGRNDEAVALAWEDLGYAKRWGSPGAVGRTLRVLGAAEGNADRLREAVGVLDGSLAKLELAHALAALGTLTGDGRALARALRLADECGAIPLAARLHAAGAEADAEAPATLTSLERRVAALDHQGGDALAIAQALFLTPGEAEEHLAAARRKLSRSGVRRT
jgi:DNA-binding SARP family transcriptional activator